MDERHNRNDTAVSEIPCSKDEKKHLPTPLVAEHSNHQQTEEIKRTGYLAHQKPQTSQRQPPIYKHNCMDDEMKEITRPVRRHRDSDSGCKVVYSHTDIDKNSHHHEMEGIKRHSRPHRHSDSGCQVVLRDC